MTIRESLENVSGSANHNFQTLVTGISGEIGTSFFFNVPNCIPVSIFNVKLVGYRYWVRRFSGSLLSDNNNQLKIIADNYRQ